MADPEHLAKIMEGINVWNMWRVENPDIKPDLISANLCEADLRKANLSNAILSNASLSGANLSGADLSGASLVKASLVGAVFNQGNLNGADMHQAMLISTAFLNIDLSGVLRLDACHHGGPSNIDFLTLMRSGSLPTAFLQGCGLPDHFIKLIPSLVSQPIQYYSCFISYSSKDDEFAQRIYADLQNNGVRCWYAPEDMKIGDKIRVRIDEVIRLHQKLLIVLSKKSIDSDWVEDEVESAIEKERGTEIPVLFPIRLDDAVMGSTTGWAAKIKRSRHIGDFTEWKDQDVYKKAFDRLLRDLKAGKESAN